MDVFKLTREGTGDAVAQACGKCGRVYALSEVTIAEECCDKALAEERNAQRRAEFDAKLATQEAGSIATAKRVPIAEYKGAMLYLDGAWNDGFLNDEEEVRDYCETNGIPMPTEVWACTATRFQFRSADDIAMDDTANGDWHEGLYDSLPDLAPIQAAIDAWNKEQGACTYFADYGTRVVLSADRP